MREALWEWPKISAEHLQTVHCARPAGLLQLQESKEDIDKDMAHLVEFEVYAEMKKEDVHVLLDIVNGGLVDMRKKGAVRRNVGIPPKRNPPLCYVRPCRRVIFDECGPYHRLTCYVHTGVCLRCDSQFCQWCVMMHCCNPTDHENQQWGGLGDATML